MPDVYENPHNRDQSFATGFNAYRGSSADQALIGGRAVKMMRSTFTDGQRSYIAWDVTGGLSIEQARPAIFCSCPREVNGRIAICPHLTFMDFLFDVYSRTWNGHTGSIDLSTSYQRARNSPRREYLIRLLYRQWRAERQIVRLPDTFLGQSEPPAWLETLPNLWQQVITASGRRECPNCGQLSRQATDTTCPSCGVRYPWAPPEPAAQPTNGPHPARPSADHPLQSVSPAPPSPTTAPAASWPPPSPVPPPATPAPSPVAAAPVTSPPAGTTPPAAPSTPHSLAGIADQPAPAQAAAGPATTEAPAWMGTQDPSAAGAWLTTVEETLRSNVLGQDAAIEVVLDTLQIALAGLAETDRPLASFLFAGPTGVGKTSLAQAIAQTMPGGKGSLLKIDCGELKSAQDVARLFGAAPGYVGYEQGGLLVNHLRKYSQGIILFDELEKSDPEVLDPLLSLLEDPEVSDAKGNVASARDYLYVGTTNIGSRRFLSATEAQDIIHEAVREDLKAHFRPELINRFDSVLIFNDLPPEVLHRIALKELNELATRIAERGKKLTWDDRVVDFLVTVGASPGFGARPIVRAVRYRVKSPLARFLLQQ
ncbi:MAG TPA: AAA family ATPase, partial [Dehalococcoidia bacterium]|nr:AAA family ATPase [Dehalococcoidia bacterium]